MKSDFFIYLFTIYSILALSTSKVCIGLSVVYYHHSNTLLPYVPICHSCNTSQWTSCETYQVPSVHSRTYHAAVVLKLTISIVFFVLMTGLWLLVSNQTLLLLVLQPLGLRASILVPRHTLWVQDCPETETLLPVNQHQHIKYIFSLNLFI